MTGAAFCIRRIRRLCAASVVVLALSINAASATDRVVILKADGLPFDLVDRWVREKDPRTGKSMLPWIDHVFYQGGARVSNFYTRGLTLSAPSWAMLDTGRYSLIKGNAEFDRLTLDTYDYLDIFSFVLKNSAGRITDTVAAQVLDEYEVPLMADAYSPSDRHVGIQLVARGLKSISIAGGFKRLLTLQNPKEWLDEWTVGVEMETVLFDVLERELIAKLQNPQVRYLDFLVPFFDHTAHLNREAETQLLALQRIDAVVRRLWTAIQESPLAEQTTLILVSDHGMNSDPTVYSQGFNLVDFFGSAAAGGHHVLTNRQPLGAYGFKSLSPTVPSVVSRSPASAYLKGQSADFPTVAIDPDGNERASVYLRQSDFNILQILRQELVRKDLAPEIRRAAAQAFFETIDRNRKRWNGLVAGLREELSSQPGRIRKANETRYSGYIQSMMNLLAVTPGDVDPSPQRFKELLPKKSLGEMNSIYDLQNYVTGLAGGGLVLMQDGSLDMVNSFKRVNYFSLLKATRTRNNVQPKVADKPVDFIAATVPIESIRSLLPENPPVDSAVWLFRDEDRQALILGRKNQQGRVLIRYVPVQHLEQDAGGEIRFSPVDWCAGLPLDIWEDSPLPVDRRSEWLADWHTDLEWLQMFHEGEYSNGIVSLQEQFTFSEKWPGDSLLARFLERKRRLSQPDFIVFANNHWNFNYRGFNPGGNHGAFFRLSTHSTLMFAGGSQTGIPRGLNIEQPYDSLSFAPTVLSLSGKTPVDSSEPFPGPLIRELFVNEP
jgi:hypothetical protein